MIKMVSGPSECMHAHTLAGSIMYMHTAVTHQLTSLCLPRHSHL